MTTDPNLACVHTWLYSPRWSDEYRHYGGALRHRCTTCGCWGWSQKTTNTVQRPYKDKDGGLVYQPRPEWRQRANGEQAWADDWSKVGASAPDRTEEFDHVETGARTPRALTGRLALHGKRGGGRG